MESSSVCTEKKCIVIFGASGDLTKKKLIPALHELYLKNRIPPGTMILGCGRSNYRDSSFRDKFKISENFKKILFYRRGYSGIVEYIKNKGSFSKIIAFLALPPAAYIDVIKDAFSKNSNPGINLVIEKPFGHDYPSSVELNNVLKEYFPEKQIFRIDHYLAKEPVQNILIFRFANSIFEPVWNNKYIESIQINSLEKNGIEERGKYFDSAGIIRDMVQNHLFQLLSLLTMDMPASLSSEDISRRKLDIIKNLEVESFQKYQYEGYLEEKNIPSESSTETYVELKLKIKNYRWAGTPIYIRTGKAVNRNGTEIGIRFKKLPDILFNKNGSLTENVIVFKVQPSEGIIIDLVNKIPGWEGSLTSTNLSFCYKSAFKNEVPEAYQRLLCDAIHGDKTLFVSSEETESAWRVLEKILGKSNLKYHKQGDLPQTGSINWINFEKYRDIC